MHKPAEGFDIAAYRVHFIYAFQSKVCLPTFITACRVNKWMQIPSEKCPELRVALTILGKVSRVFNKMRLVNFIMSLRLLLYVI